MVYGYQNRQQASERLQSPEGERLRSQQPVEAESVFSQVKHNKKFRRFLLLGLENVNIEWGLVSIDRNLQSSIINWRSCDHFMIAWELFHRHSDEVKLHYNLQLSTGEASL